MQPPETQQPEPQQPATQQSEALADIESHKTITAIAETARRASGADPDLPHPFETDRNLATFLTSASVAASGSGAGWRARIGRLVLNYLLPSQLAYNDAMVNVIHQLDHRDRQQREEIANLHQRLSALDER